MEHIANFFLSKHIEKPIDYASQYLIKEDETVQEVEEKRDEETTKEMDVEALVDKQKALIKALKAFRLEQSRKEQVKCEKYGSMILNIFKENA